MENLILFFNSFLSYLVLMLIILAVGGVGFAIGLTLRKKKNAALAAAEDGGPAAKDGPGAE